MRFPRGIAVVGMALTALLVAIPAFSQIRTPYNSYPPTPAERAQTAELNRGANQENWDSSDFSSQAQYQGQYRRDEQYRRDMWRYRQQMMGYRLAERRYWDQLRSMRDAGYEWSYGPPSAPSYERNREHEADAGIIGQQVQILTGDYVGKIVDVDRDATKKIEGLYVELHGGKVVWIDVNDVRYNNPYGVIYTDLNWGALYHMPDERM